MRKLFDAVLWERGFRPFFLLGALYSFLAILFWAISFGGTALPFPLGYDPVLWHAHEMIYGFTVAIIAGFLLTAVANWTGGETARDHSLFALCLLWLAGRVAVILPVLPYSFAAVIDLSFLPALTISLVFPLLRSRSRNNHNFIFVFMLGALFLCNLFFWAQQDRAALHLALVIIMAIISAIGGRVIPSFTVAGLRRKGLQVRQMDQRKTDFLALASIGIFALFLLFPGDNGYLQGVAALAAAGLHGWRQRLYHTRLVWSEPMLWSLHAGHMWLIAGFALWGLSSFGLISFSPALHALTAGAIGSLTLSMMCRVALGHTGREIGADRPTSLSFVLMQGAAFIRVLGPLLFPLHYGLWIIISGALWAASFGIYVAVYGPILRQRQENA